MAGFGTVQIGRLSLREALSVASETADSSGRTLKLTGQEAVPAVTAAQLAAYQDDLPSLIGQMVAVTFTDKADRNGYFTVTGAQADLMNWNGELVTCTWQLTLARVGTDTEVDLESRLSGSLARTNAYGITAGERTHCPPIGHYAYWSGPAQPSVVVRQCSEGLLTVYRGVSGTANPRYGCAVSGYQFGRVRFLDAWGIERSGLEFSARPLVPALLPSTTVAPSTTLVPSSGQATTWTLHNALVQVAPATSGGVLTVSAWTGNAWQAKTWDIRVGGVSIGPADTVTVLRNEFEIVVLRLLRSQYPGRVTIDLTLRRGSRLVEMYVQAEYSTTLSVVRGTTESATAGTGYLTAAANDGAGNRYIIGSAGTYTADTTNGGISVSSAVALDCFVGVVAGGSTAVSGDRAADLYGQYLAQPAETVQAVRR